MTVEEWAQQIIEKGLGRPVAVHDDGSQPSMYDLRIGDAESPEVVIECVGAVDAVGTLEGAHTGTPRVWWRS